MKRPGVQVRARRGYLAPSAAEVAAAAARAKANYRVGARSGVVSKSKRRRGRARAAQFAGARAPLHLQAVAGWRPGGTAGVWAVGEVSVAPVWKAGADVDVMLVGERRRNDRGAKGAGRGGDATLSQRRSLHRVAIAPGDYTVNVRARGRGLDLGTDQCVAGRACSAPHRSRATRSSFAGARRPATGKCARRTSASGAHEQVGVDMPSAARRAGAGAPARPQRPAAAVAGHGGGARRSGRIAMADGARVARAACAGRLHARDDHGLERKLVGFRIVP